MINDTVDRKFTKPREIPRINTVTPGTPEEAEAIAKQQWSSDRKLLEEFLRFATFAAFRRHEQNVRIVGGKVVKNSRLG